MPYISKFEGAEPDGTAWTRVDGSAPGSRYRTQLLPWAVPTLEHMVDTPAQPSPQIPADPDWPQSPAARNAQDLAELVMASPSSFHAAAEGARRLEAAGFHQLDERDAWSGDDVRQP